MKTFDYHTPTTVDEALSILARYGDDAHFMAGGTSMMLLMQQGLVQPGHVVGLRGVSELRGINHPRWRHSDRRYNVASPGREV